jgi:subtilase family serine protease
MSIHSGQSPTRAGLVVLLAVITLLAGSAFSQAATSRTSRLLPNVQNLGPENLSKPITVTVWLNQHNKAAFDELVHQMYQKGSPNYHKWLTREQYNANFAPTAADVATAREFLTSHNLQVSAVDKNNHFISAQGKVSDMQSAFHVQINRFQRNGETFRANTSEPLVEGAASKVVASIQGLSDLKYKPYVMRPINPETGTAFPYTPLASAVGPDGLFFNGNCFTSPITRKFRTGHGGPEGVYSGNRYGSKITSGAPHLPPCGYDALDIQKGYGLQALYKKSLSGTGQTIAIIDAFGSDTIVPDTTEFTTLNNLPPLVVGTNFQIYYPSGPTSCGSSCGWNDETTLDVQWSHTVAPGANVALVLAADNSFTNLDTAILYAIETGLGNSISNSWGIEEELLAEFLPSELVVENNLSELGASLGMSVNFSTGDKGDFFAADGFTTVSMPASSPYSTGVGGTSLFLKPSRAMNFQTGWGNNETRIAAATPNPPIVPPLQLGFIYGAGGGTSGVWSAPSYQSSLSSSWRMVPDISYVADPYTGVEIVITPDGIAGDPQEVGVIGGTSLACPMFSAMWAIANQAAGVPLGQAAPLLYGLPSGAITDVTDVNSPSNVSGTIYSPPNPPTPESASDLAQPLGNTTDFVSAFYNGTSTRWYVLTFGTDSSLTTSAGWDNVTGLGTPNGLTFVQDVVAATQP